MRNIKILLPLLLLLSCSRPKDLVYNGVDHLRIQKAGLAHSTVAVELHFYNPNKYTLKLKEANVDVYLNGTRLGKILADDLYTFPALGNSTLPVMLDVDMKNVLPNALQILLNKTVDMKLNGTVKAGAHGVYINIPIDYQGKQELLMN